MRGILFLKNSIVAREPPAKSETGLKPAPPVIKTRIGECKAAHQSSDQWIGKLKYLSHSPLLHKDGQSLRKFLAVRAVDCSVEPI
jgi:hypothetical protein